MERVAEVGDVVRGRFSDRTYTVTAVGPVYAQLTWGDQTTDTKLTSGGAVDPDSYIFVRSATSPKPEDLMPGDRVRFRYKNNAGTVVRKGDGSTNQYLIQWDHRSDELYEYRGDLVVLHAPRGAAEPLPAQKAIDEVDALRETVKAEVKRLQGQLRDLKKIKNTLMGVELR